MSPTLRAAYSPSPGERPETMAPDVNSLPPSPNQQQTRRPSINALDHIRPSPPSPRSPSLASLQAAAAINAGLHHRSPSGVSPRRDSRGLERRRSSLMNNLSINDPSIPAPGELQPSSGSNSNSPRLERRSVAYGTADPNHQRQPSLGEIHQSIENEQEAQVNRLLHMIRIQQDQIAQIQRQQQQPQEPSPTSTEQTHFPTPPSTINTPAGTNVTDQSSSRSTSISTAAHTQSHFNRPHSLSRTSSARLSNAGTNSRTGSPAQPPIAGGIGPLTEDFLLGGTRDECAFYQAETQTLTRENQMLKQRIRELGKLWLRNSREQRHADEIAERQISAFRGGAVQGEGMHASPPATTSPLATQPSTFTGEAAPPIAAEVNPAAGPG